MSDPIDEAGPASWAHELLADLGVDPSPHDLSIAGRDPVIPTCFRAGEAAAAVLGAQALAAAELWRLRGGGSQQVSVDVHAAAASLRSFLFFRLPAGKWDREPPATVGFYQGRDGEWIHLHGGFPHLHEQTVKLLGCADGAEPIARAVAAWETPALEDALAAQGLCGARLRTAADWHAHPQGATLARTPLVEVLRIGPAAPYTLPGLGAHRPDARPLSGMRVLDLTRVLAGPTCARTLAEHGADVLHVRSPRLPFIEPFVIDTNVGKRSCYLDLDHDADADQLWELVRSADVFSQGYRGSALARRGFGADALARLRPGIIVVSINCYGHAGPWVERPGWEQLAQTATGMAHEHGGSESPALIPAAVNDYITGYLAALGVLRALARRTSEGGSWHVRVSLARTAMWVASLPRVPAEHTATGIMREALAPWMIAMDTEWGRLTRLGPIARMSATPPRWERPPVPLGHDEARWV